MANMKLIYLALVLCAITVESWTRSIETTDEPDDDNSGSDERKFYQQSNVHQSFSHGTGNGGSSLITSRSSGSDGNNIFIKVTNPLIVFDGNTFNCSGLICSKDAYKCETSGEADSSDQGKLNSVAKCVDKSGTVLDTKEFIENNPYPNSAKPYKRSGIVTADGEVVLEDSNGYLNHIAGQGGSALTKEQQEELQKKIAETTRVINEQIYQQQLELQKHMQDIASRFGNFWQPNYQPFPSFPTFPFIQPFFPPGFPFNNYPGYLNAGYQYPAYHNPGYQNPGYQNPGYQYPSAPTNQRLSTGVATPQYANTAQYPAGQSYPVGTQYPAGSQYQAGQTYQTGPQNQPTPQPAPVPQQPAYIPTPQPAAQHTHIPAPQSSYIPAQQNAYIPPPSQNLETPHDKIPENTVRGEDQTGTAQPTNLQNVRPEDNEVNLLEARINPQVFNQNRYY